MGGLVNNRKALLAGGALVASLLGAPMAAAQEVPTAAPDPQASMESGEVDFTDTQTVLRRQNVSVRNDVVQRFAAGPAASDTAQGPRRVEVEFAAGDGDLDVSFAQRASLGAGADGNIDRAGRGSEVRIGRGLVAQDDNRNNQTSTYVFVASDNEALTWQPGQRSEFGGQGASLQLQDRVQVGDMSVGVTYERSGVQASLAYVEREEATTVGTQTFNQNESFTGLTVTMRR
ncbi:MAG: hypothetical protein KF779_12495 [Hyphomonadaceae bacterium]|nr:hypothetical protein [Hyphomonadaceae bacterium]